MFLKNTTQIYLITTIALLASCNKTDDPYLEITNTSVYNKSAFTPEDNVKFSTYVANSKENIAKIINTVRPNLDQSSYLGKYSNLQTIEMRAPFEVKPTEQSQCKSNNQKGFLLVHGLTDSPYLMRSLSKSLNAKYPCATIRSVLLPGHGSVVGNSLNMTNSDWKKIVKYGINRFKNDNKISDLYLAGFSTGTTLLIDYMNNNHSNTDNTRDDKVKGLILLSVAVKAKSNFAFLSPFVARFMDWLSILYERDAARYESFSFNAGGQFYELTKDMFDPKNALKIPVLMAISADDDTIDAQAARAFFCYAKDTDTNKNILIWYQSINSKVNAEINADKQLNCNNITEVKLDALQKKYKTLNLAHIAIPVDPADAHYGFDGIYHNCKKYDTDKKMTEDFKNCQNNDFDYVFSENNVKIPNVYIRRGTFNPDYKNLENKIFCFIDGNCSLENKGRIKGTL